MLADKMIQDMSKEHPTVNHERLIATFDELSQIGRCEDGSIDRRAFNDADMEARRWLVEQAKKRGFESRIDSAGNVRIRPKGMADDAAPVLLGSHLDSVPNGGAFDGALGVMIGFEVLSTMADLGHLPDHAVEVVGFSDEEGRFGGMLGARALAGLLSPADINSSMDLEGTVLRDAMAAQGLKADDVLHARVGKGTYRAYLEVHVEQGPVLDETGEQLGLVTDITGLIKWLVTLRGQPDHAGTTPMRMRHDAFQGLAEFATEIPRLLEENGSDDSIATIGNVSLYPGAANSVPGEAVFSVDARDADPETLDELGRAMRRALSAIARRRGLMFEFEVIGQVDPTPCDDEVVKAIDDAARSMGVEPYRMPSGAAHDAQAVAAIAPIGMIFTPSVGGRSHCAAEWTHRDDIELAADVALNATLRLAGAPLMQKSKTKSKK